MAMKKKSLISLVVLACVVIGGGYLYMNLGGIIVRTAEKIASDALGVKVDIGLIRISLSDKKVTVSSLKIANPPGYHNSHIMTADSIDIGLNGASKDLIDFKDITVKGSVVNLEVNEKGNMNLNDLKRLSAKKEQRESAGSKQVRVIIDHMVIDASTINPSITLLPGQTQPIKLPAITFSNMGKGGGMEADDAIVQVMGKYLSAIEKEARDSGLFKGLPGTDDVKKTLDDAAGSLKSLFK